MSVPLFLLLSCPPLPRVKMRSQSILLTAAVTALNVLAQFVPAPTDLISTVGYADVKVRYKQVPTGICELDPDVKSFSGYADVL